MFYTALPQVNCHAKWTYLIQKSKRCVHDINVSMVKWIKPPDQWLKVNTNGSALTNPGQIGAGGILKDKEDRIVMAFTIPLGEGTNNKVK